MATIVNLAQNFVGSNNINVLMPIGQFGTRLQGGKDSASPRYIFTMLRLVVPSVVPALDRYLSRPCEWLSHRDNVSSDSSTCLCVYTVGV